MKILKSAGQTECYINHAPHITDGSLFFTHLGIRWRALDAAPDGAVGRTPPKELLNKAKQLVELSL